jgi:hypothetical protein
MVAISITRKDTIAKLFLYVTCNSVNQIRRPRAMGNPTLAEKIEGQDRGPPIESVGVLQRSLYRDTMLLLQFLELLSHLSNLARLCISDRLGPRL